MSHEAWMYLNALDCGGQDGLAGLARCAHVQSEDTTTASRSKARALC